MGTLVSIKVRLWFNSFYCNLKKCSFRFKMGVQREFKEDDVFPFLLVIYV